MTGAGPIQRAIYDWTILGLGLSVKSEAVNGRRGGVPLFGRKSFQRCTLRCFNAWCHTGLQFALTVVCVCPQPGSGRWASVQTWAERTSEAKCFREAWRPCEASLKTKGALWTHLSRKSLSTTAEMSSRGFPIPKSVFSLCRDRSRLFHSDSHASSPHNYQSLVSDLMDLVSVALICLLLFWKLSMNNNICATHGTRKCDHLQKWLRFILGKQQCSIMHQSGTNELTFNQFLFKLFKTHTQNEMILSFKDNAKFQYIFMQRHNVDVS